MQERTRYSYLADKSTTRDVLARFGFYTKHRLGQNFLIDDTVIEKIIRLADLEEHASVLEVGPGIGTLTCALLDQGMSVCAIEADTQLREVLPITCEFAGARLQVLFGDALGVRAEELLHFVNEQGVATPSHLVSNLPYQIAATLILRYFEDMPFIKDMCVMVQSEVADRMCARIKEKLYGAYSAKLALYAEYVGSFVVSRESFMPAPHVTSQVIKLTRIPTNALLCEGIERTQICSFIDMCFAQRRKTLINCLKHAGFDGEHVRSCLLAMGIDERIRAERLQPKEFVVLYRRLKEVYVSTQDICGR